MNVLLFSRMISKTALYSPEQIQECSFVHVDHTITTTTILLLRPQEEKKEQNKKERGFVSLVSSGAGSNTYIKHFEV